MTYRIVQYERNFDCSNPVPTTRENMALVGESQDEAEAYDIARKFTNSRYIADVCKFVKGKWRTGGAKLDWAFTTTVMEVL